MNRPDLIIVEGPDGAGKSTLVERLAGWYKAEVVHHGPYKGKKKLGDTYLSSFVPDSEGTRFAKTKTVILDRSWLSEDVYGPIFRGGSRLTVGDRRVLLRAALGARGAVIVALPPFETCLKNIAGRAKDAYLEDNPKFKEVYDAFAGMITTFKELPVARYDFTQDGTSERVRSWLNWVRSSCSNPGPGWGNWDPRHVFLIVGEQPGDARVTEKSRTEVPFAGFEGCSPWLAEQLEAGGIAESSLYWVNARSRSGKLTDSTFVAKLKPRGVLALGIAAAAWCGRARGIGPGRFAELSHPQHHKRFFFKKSYGIREALKTAEKRMTSLSL